MARARRNWGEMKRMIYGHLSEEAADSHWSPEYLLDVANECKDELEMEMQQKAEGFGKEIWKTDIVADQSYYSYPAHLGRVTAIVRYFPELDREVPLIRSERISTPTYTTGVGKLSIPSYRLVNNQILIEPPIGEAVTNGLRVEMEACSELLANDNSELPSDWPLFTETLIVLRTTKAAFDDEASQDESAERELTAGFRYRLRRYEANFHDWVSNRARSRQFAVPFRQGA